MDGRVSVRVAEKHRLAEEAVKNRLARCGLENIGWTDEAREASLAARRGLAASKALGGAKYSPAAIAAREKAKAAPKPKSAGIHGYGIRAPDAPPGNPDTPVEGKVFNVGGFSFVVKNGVLQYYEPASQGPAGRYQPGGYVYGRVVGKGGRLKTVSPVVMQKSLFAKLAREGVNVDWIQGKPSKYDDGRRY